MQEVIAKKMELDQRIAYLEGRIVTAATQVQQDALMRQRVLMKINAIELHEQIMAERARDYWWPEWAV